MDALIWMLNYSMKRVMRLLCQIDDSELDRVPKDGPLILVSNHINFLDVPIMYTHLFPRPMRGFAKIETWNNPFLGKLFDIWGAIPIHRGELDMSALRSALAALKTGMIIGIAPEGTRSGSGELNRGHPGVVIIALKSGVPVLPLGLYGIEKYKSNIMKLRRTKFHIRVGFPFYIDPGRRKVTSELRREIVDEIMYQIANLLPHQYRGRYSNLEDATSHYLQFLSPSDLQMITTDH